MSTGDTYGTKYVLSESAIKFYLQCPLDEISLKCHFRSTIKPKYFRNGAWYTDKYNRTLIEKLNFFFRISSYQLPVAPLGGILLCHHFRSIIKPQYIRNGAIDSQFQQKSNGKSWFIFQLKLVWITCSAPWWRIWYDVVSGQLQKPLSIPNGEW